MKHNPDPLPHTDDDSVSAFIDGELSDEMLRHTARTLADSEVRRSRHAEYLLIGDALRGVITRPTNLTERVMAALDSEPTVLAPMHRQASRRPMLWLAAASVAALTWGIWATLPSQDDAPVQLAASQPNGVQALLAAHEDFAQAVVSSPDMHYTRITLAEAGR
jgi:negative regulator of sigma E activity